MPNGVSPPVTSIITQYTRARIDASFLIGSTIPPMGTLTISSTGLTDLSGSETLAATYNTYTATAVLGKTLSTFAGAQSNTIAIPSGATGYMIFPPSANTVGLTLKGIAGDTGNPLSPNLPTGPVTLPTVTPANFVITSAAAVTGNVLILFF